MTSVLRVFALSCTLGWVFGCLLLSTGTKVSPSVSIPVCHSHIFQLTCLSSGFFHRDLRSRLPVSRHRRISDTAW